MPDKEPLSVITNKASIKWLEVPLQKFNSAVPHFVELIKNHHCNIKKLQRVQQWEELKREYNNASRAVSQLTCLLNDINNLRKQVAEDDLPKFDKLISNSKQSAISVIQSHQNIHIQSYTDKYEENKDLYSNKNEQCQDQTMQKVATLTKEIENEEERAASMERLQTDIEDINELFQELSQLVQHQGEHVEKIEEHVEETHHNVVEGESMLRQAVKYKRSVYPLMGALIGTAVAGPVGLLAGFKLGSVTAVGCGFLGFTGGKFLKNQD